MFLIFIVDVFSHFSSFNCTAHFLETSRENAANEHEPQILYRKFRAVWQEEKNNHTQNQLLHKAKNLPCPLIVRLPFDITHSQPNFSLYRDHKTILRI